MFHIFLVCFFMGRKPPSTFLMQNNDSITKNMRREHISGYIIYQRFSPEKTTPFIRFFDTRRGPKY